MTNFLEVKKFLFILIETKSKGHSEIYKSIIGLGLNVNQDLI